MARKVSLQLIECVQMI